MDLFLKETPDILFERVRQLPSNEKVYEKLLKESNGSFDGQFEIVNRAVKILIQELKNNKFVWEDGYKKVETVINNPYNVRLVLFWKEDKYGDGICRGEKNCVEGETVVTLRIHCGSMIIHNLAGTIAHEIMHVYQGGLKKINGVNETSAKLYKHILTFVRNAPMDFSQYFFHGLYLCYSIEASANISSIANYLNFYFEAHPNLNRTTRNVQFVLKRNDKRNEYIDILNVLEENNPTEQDIQYIYNCLTTPVENVENDDKSPIFDENNFNVNSFIVQNRKTIIEKCQETLNKMNKNVLEWLQKS